MEVSPFSSDSSSKLHWYHQRNQNLIVPPLLVLVETNMDPRDANQDARPQNISILPKLGDAVDPPDLALTRSPDLEKSREPDLERGAPCSQN